MFCTKYIFVSFIKDGANGLQWEQAGDRRISVPGYLGYLSLAWTTKGLKITMDKSVCRVRVAEETLTCDSEFLLPWQTEDPILLLHEIKETVFAQVCISKTDDRTVWDIYKNTILDREARILSDIYEQECYFWRALAMGDDLPEAYDRLCELISDVEDTHSVTGVLGRLKHLQYKYSVKLLNSKGQGEEALDRTACVIRSLMVDECHKL